MPATRARTAKLYAPGAHAPFSGVYRVIHDEHRPAHNAVVVKGDEFPTCRECHNRVRYELRTEANYVTHEWDFSGPNPKLVK